MKDSDFMQTIEQALLKLEKSKFRSSFKLKEKDREYVKNKGMDTVRSHARDFVRDRLAPSFIANDGQAKHPCADTLCLLHNTQRRAAAAVALTSGTEYRKMLNLLLPNKKK